jgi:hypothetical protein
MRKFLSERNLVVFLFFVALVVFTLAQEDAKKVEKMYSSPAYEASSSVLSTPPQTAEIPGKK